MHVHSEFTVEGERCIPQGALGFCRNRRPGRRVDENSRAGDDLGLIGMEDGHIIEIPSERPGPLTGHQGDVGTGARTGSRLSNRTCDRAQDQERGASEHHETDRLRGSVFICWEWTPNVKRAAMRSQAPDSATASIQIGQD